MAHSGRRALTVVAVLVALGASASSAAAPDVTVRARFTFAKNGVEFSKLQVLITRGSVMWRSGPLGTTYFRPPTIAVRDLDADGEPEVLFDTYTGGAHCCFQTHFFRWLPAREAYGRTFRGWSHAGYRAKNLDGRGPVELLSADARFAYVFTAFAGSAFPIQVWELDSARLRDVTRLFPGQVALDAKRLWRWYLDSRRTGDVRGILAAWQADQYLLGREDEGWKTLAAIQKRRELGPRSDLTGWPQGSAYLKTLRAYLLKLGYA